MVPVSVGKRVPWSSTPALSHARSWRRRYGLGVRLARRGACAMRSKHFSMSASRTYLAFWPMAVKIAAIASWQERPGRKPIAVGFEARLPFGFQGAFDECVAGSIGHGWDAERSVLRRAWFRDPDAADRCSAAVEGQGLCQGEALG